jgi:hypothetical protein
MYSIERPQDNFTNLLTACIQRCKKKKSELTAFIPTAQSRASEYEEKAIESRLNAMQPLSIDEELRERLTALYSNHFAKEGKIGREIYDKLILLANGKCPFCSADIAFELDHFLPKKADEEGFPEFAVLPLNLVPICHRCNKTKGESFSNLEEEQFIHPYFDRIDDVRWLYATIDKSFGKIDFKFLVDASSIPNEVLQKRLEYHFNELKLNSIYSLKAAEEFCAHERKLQKDFKEHGLEFIQQDLLEKAESCEAYNKNSWRTAMYYALSQNVDLFSSSNI